MPDFYKNFGDLAAAERLGIDNQIQLCRRPSPIAIIAPHGGKIEPGTSAPVIAIAETTFSLYCFEGIKRDGNRQLHVTSARFDEPQCVSLVAASDYIVALHGCAGTGQKVYLGGLDMTLRTAIQYELAESGFETGTHGNPNLQGLSPLNICNRSRRGIGVQLELSRGLRNELENTLSQEQGPFSEFVAAMQRAIGRCAG